MLQEKAQTLSTSGCKIITNHLRKTKDFRRSGRMTFDNETAATSANIVKNHTKIYNSDGRFLITQFELIFYKLYI